MGAMAQLVGLPGLLSAPTSNSHPQITTQQLNDMLSAVTMVDGDVTINNNRGLTSISPVRDS